MQARMWPGHLSARPIMVFHARKLYILLSNARYATKKQPIGPEAPLLLLSVQSYLSKSRLISSIFDISQMFLMALQVRNTTGSCMSRTISANSLSYTLSKVKHQQKWWWGCQNGLVHLAYLLLFRQIMEESLRVFWSCSCYLMVWKSRMEGQELLELKD